MDIQPDLSVCIIPAMIDTDLSACVESILVQNDPVLLEIFLPAGCGLEARFSDRSEVHFVEYPHARQGDTIHHVWQQAAGRYLAVFYSSVTAGAGSLFAMIDFLDDHPDVGGAAPRIFSSETILQSNCFRTSLPFLPPKKMSGWDGSSSLEADWLSPDVFFVNRLAFEECSSESFKGEIWSRSLCRELRAKGWHQFFVHYARVVCHSSLQTVL